MSCSVMEVQMTLEGLHSGPAVTPIVIGISGGDPKD